MTSISIVNRKIQVITGINIMNTVFKIKNKIKEKENIYIYIY